MYSIELNGYEEHSHWAAMNEKNVYLSYSGDFGEGDMGHMHKSIELLLVEEGVADYFVNDVCYQLTPRSLFIVGSMDPHKRHLKSLPFVRYGLTVMPGYLESLPIVNEYLGVYQTQTSADFSKLSGMPPETFDEIRSIFLALGEETVVGKRGQSDMIYALMLRLTILLTRLLRSDKVSPEVNAAYQAMLEIRDFIDGNFAEPLSLTALSKKFFVGPTVISRGFADCFGTNISDYINSVRMTNAVRLLETTGDSVTDIAMSVGYRSVNTFIRQFGQKLGTTPLQYRKQFFQYLQARH